MTDFESQTFDRRKFVVGATATVAGVAILGPGVAHADASESPWMGGLITAVPSGNSVVVRELPLTAHHTVRVDLSRATGPQSHLRPGQTVMIQGAQIASEPEIAAERVIAAGFGERSDLPAARQ